MLNEKDEGWVNDNSFDCLRIFAAICIMLGHFVWKNPISVDEYVATKVVWKIVSTATAYFPGVPILIALSGFLIAKSRESNNIGIFTKKRIIRIYPSIWLCTVIYAITYCCICYRIIDKSFAKWLFAQIFGIAYTPSCLESFATGSVNGALWTIMVEIQLYIIVALFGKLMEKFNFFIWTFILCGSLTLSVACDYFRFGNALDKLVERSFFPYLLWFLIGAFAYYKREAVVKILRKIFLPLLVGYVIILSIVRYYSVSIPGYYCNILTGVMVPILTISFAYWFGFHRIKNEISYEMFLYHWLILNVFVYYGISLKIGYLLSLLLFTVSSIAISLLMNRANRFVNQKMDKLFK